MAQTVKNLPAIQKTRVRSLGQKDPLEKGMQPTPVFLSGESRGQRNLVGHSPWGYRAGHDWTTDTFTCTDLRNSTVYFLMTWSSL